MNPTRIYKCLCDPLRLRVLNLLQEGPLCVCHLMEILDCDQVRMSKQLRYMKEQGMVDGERVSAAQVSINIFMCIFICVILVSHLLK